MKNGDGATGWLYAGCRASRDDLGQYAKTPVAPDPTTSITSRRRTMAQRYSATAHVVDGASYQSARFRGLLSVSH